MTQSSSSAGRLSLRASARGIVTRPHYGSASGVLQLHGRAMPKIPILRVAAPSHGMLRLKGSASGLVNAPWGAFRDFAHYPNSALDPAMVLVQGHNGGATDTDVTQVSGYRRYFVLASPPLDYPVSGGAKAWPRAAYASIGLRLKGLVYNGFAQITGAQSEIAQDGATTPVPYQRARALNCVVVPQRVNLIMNPRLGVDASGWGNIGGFGATRVAQGSGWAWTMDGQMYPWMGTASAAGSVGQHWSGSIVVSGPVGRVVDVRINDGVEDIAATNNVILTGVPQTINVVSSTAATGTTPRIYVYTWGPIGAWTGGQMLTATNALLEVVSGVGVAPSGDYFDGGYGEDYLWSGAPNASPSCYYPDRVNRSYLISQLLAENCPLGVTPGVPQFGVIPA